MQRPVMRTFSELKAMPKPRNTRELEVLSAWYFGIPLHLGEFFVGNGHARYRVSEPYNDYHGKGWLFDTHSIDGYDYSERFWQFVVGNLYCGGIARYSYGQTRHVGFREQKRLESLRDSWAMKQPGRLRTSLARLAEQTGLGENTTNRDSRVHIGGREDGASGASSTRAKEQP